MPPSESQLASSFRDPAGFLFKRGAQLFRQVNQSYSQDFRLLIDSGLYRELTQRALLIEHEEVQENPFDNKDCFKLIKPRMLDFISYPSEWCFSALKDAALLTLQIQKIALGLGMSLKDASAYNVQFISGAPILIDSLSFERYIEGEPWQAYRQFCQHFLGPLLLLAKCDIRLATLFRDFMDGIPLDLVSSLLPFSTRFNLSTQLHIHLHAKTQQRYADSRSKQKIKAVSKKGLLGLLDNLESSLHKLRWQPAASEWADYYRDTNYSERAAHSKAQIICAFLEELKPVKLWDLGANTGEYSALAYQQGIQTVAFDLDASAVEKHYLKIRRDREKMCLPLVLDLTNPTPAYGFASRERSSLTERGPVDCVMALALIHHLAIGNNLPFKLVASYFAALGRNLIIEFVPKHDSQVQRLLNSRKDIFENYQQEDFEQAFSQYFKIKARRAVEDSARVIYLMSHS